MANLNSFIIDQVQELPRIILTSLLEEKFESEGIENDERLIEAIVEHVISGDDEEFEWSNPKYDDLSIEFTEADALEVERRLKKFLKDGLPKVIRESVADSAKDLVKTLLKDWPEQRIYERSESQPFCERLELRWGKGLDALSCSGSDVI